MPRMLSQMTTPMSTIVPIAIAIPESATTLASTPKCFIAMKHINTDSGNRPEIIPALRRCATISSTTSTVTRISSRSASLSVPSVSWINPVRS